ncbi:hypothetical protein GJU39_09900 [Pedobacter petrophilus]|uniref:VCBS repeat-containing protein n=1 Tax=Pedobacter petrophilus TaxID=1908241 RepID=A0A7K0FY74_9SPHI|nr:hypothetical protein [Pedobacter petrophilus]MRX76401.1 hypothetical protein [Pedobacter petrophilus]
MKLLLTFLILFSFKLSAQKLISFIPPSGYTKVLETNGDLDKDGINEVVLVYNTNRKTDRTGFTREMYICKLINGSLKLWKKNASVLWNSDDCGFCLDSGINLSVKIKGNTLIIEQTFQHNSRHFSTYRNIFRHQNGDWFLIGSKYNDYDTCHFDFQYDINFSTNQVAIDYTFGDCDDGVPVPKDSELRFKYPFKSIPKMDGFTAGKHEIKIPNAKQYFYY